jgi:hypothetical protein
MCRVLYKVILDHCHLGAQLISVVPTALACNFLELPSGAMGDFRNFAPEGRRDYSVFEKIAKN